MLLTFSVGLLPHSSCVCHVACSIFRVKDPGTGCLAKEWKEKYFLWFLCTHARSPGELVDCTLYQLQEIPKYYFIKIKLCVLILNLFCYQSNNMLQRQTEGNFPLPVFLCAAGVECNNSHVSPTKLRSIALPLTEVKSICQKYLPEGSCKHKAST